MRAAFVLTAIEDPTGYVCADFCVRALKRHMPDVEVWHLTDDRSPPVTGVDRIQRRTQAGTPFARYIAEHVASISRMEEGDWLLLDTDVVVQRDIRSVFEQEAFDVAVADRAGTFVSGEEGSEFMAAMPYNGGVIFSRRATAWEAIATHIATLPSDHQAWLGVQLALASLIQRGAIWARILPSTFNYPPHAAGEDVSDKALVHYKGPWRKQCLIQRIYRETCVSG